MPALARRDGDAHHHSGGAAGAAVDPRRPGHDRNRGRAADRAAARRLGARGRAGLAAHRALGRNAHADGRAHGHGAGGGQPRRGAECLAALPRHRRDGLRHRHRAAGGTDAGARHGSRIGSASASPWPPTACWSASRPARRSPLRWCCPWWAKAGGSISSCGRRRCCSRRSCSSRWPRKPAVPQTSGPAGDRQRQRAPLVAGLEQPADLAARAHVRQQQRGLLRHQCLPAGLSRQPRPRRPDRRGFGLDER